MKPHPPKPGSRYSDVSHLAVMRRRDFIRQTALAGGAVVASGLRVMAGPFTPQDFSRLVPEDKKLARGWVESLFARGGPEVLRGADLQYVGMPIGGLCSGQLYLGGDGRLWRWDIFNQMKPTDAGHYAKPPRPDFPIAQGFALRLGQRIVSLDTSGFRDVSFRGEYPIGRVEYRDAEVPLAVTLEAFSPFIPLNTEDSSLPATVLQFTVSNTSDAAVEATLVGNLENAVLLHHRTVAGTRQIRILRGEGHTFLDCTARPSVGIDAAAEAPTKLPDFGSMGLALLGSPAEVSSGDDERPVAEKLSGHLGRHLKLAAGQSATVTFILAWHFPNLVLINARGPGPKKPGLIPDEGRYYATRFADAAAVAAYCTRSFTRLAEQTRLWRDVWYDSTLPYWFLDRTQINTSVLATSTCYRLGNGRFWGWEGVGCCAGTCTHVWHYAHAMGRQFPELERILRERTDFGLALQPDGAIHFRGENNKIPAIDGQAGAILRALREHQMSADGAFLRRIWPGVKRATDWLIAQDRDEDGLIAGKQHNTLDADWYGPVAWLSGLYLAALGAAAVMADEVGDHDYAAKCRSILARGRTKLVGELFDREYFVNRVDPAHADAINSGTGCEIDQVMGQSWAFQVGLPRVLPEKETKAALQALWKYNFTPDVGPYRERYKAGRWYAMPGEAGLLMCTFPRTDWDFERASGTGKGKPTFAGYFNECMNGFEYQVAGHMLWENMVLEGLAITRAVHDRYHASRRNPWNEVECGDHYARSMASYGVYLAACGFEYDGPRGHLGFAPRLTPENFRCAFTGAEGWGTYAQNTSGETRRAEINVRWGRLKLKTFAWDAGSANGVQVIRGGQTLPATWARRDGRLVVSLGAAVDLGAGDTLAIVAT